MKKSAVIVLMGGILVLIGFILIAWFGLFGNQTENFQIPAGDEYYYYFEAPSSAVGHVDGDFSVTTGTVDMYVLTEDQYEYYSYWGTATSGSLYSSSGSSGTFSCNLSGSGKTYIVFDHGPGYGSMVQSVKVNLNSNAVDLMMIIPGIVLVIVGIIAIIVGKRMQKKETPPVMETQPQITDVTMFDQKKP